MSIFKAAIVVRTMGVGYCNTSTLDGEFDKSVASVMSGFDVAIVDSKSDGAKLHGANMLEQSN